MRLSRKKRTKSDTSRRQNRQQQQRRNAPLIFGLFALVLSGGFMILMAQRVSKQISNGNPSSSSSSSLSLLQDIKLSHFQLSSSSLSSSVLSLNEKNLQYPPISCGGLNKSLDIHLPWNLTSSSRETNTDPSFWISIHSKKVDRVRWSIMQAGYYYETGMTQLFATILKNENTNKDNGIVVDIGMNIGWFSLWSAALGYKVYAFEPNMLNQFRVCESIELNKWGPDMIKVFPFGVGNVANTLTMKWSSRNPGMASFLENSKNAINSITANVIRLDDFAIDQGWLSNKNNNEIRYNNNKFSIALLKVDVEGFEPQVFLGAKELIQSGLVDNIIMEFSLHRYTQQQARDMLMFLIQAGYNLQYIGNYMGIENKEVEQHVLQAQTNNNPNEILINRLMDWQTTFKAKGDDGLNLWWQKKT